MARSSGVMAVLLGLAIGMAGCQPVPPKQQEQKIWEGIKIGELAPPPNDRLPPPKFLGAIKIDIQALELPADNVSKLDELWTILSPGPIRMNSYNAFMENSFRVKFGRMEMWDKILEQLTAVDAQRVAAMSLSVPDNDSTDLPVANLPVGCQITFIGNNLARQRVTVGPGMLMLRLRAEPIPWMRGARKLIAYPVHKLPLTTAIPQIQASAQRQEFYFDSAAFALPMAPGDLVVLGPDKYTGERTSLAGLFFNNPEGSLFFNPSKAKPPEHKPAARVYILVCTAVSD